MIFSLGANGFLEAEYVEREMDPAIKKAGGSVGKGKNSNAEKIEEAATSDDADNDSGEIIKCFFKKSKHTFHHGRSLHSSHHWAWYCIRNSIHVIPPKGYLRFYFVIILYIYIIS